MGFGHSHASFGSTHIDSWGVGPFVILVDGKRYWFEDSDMFGPVLTSKRGHILNKQPGSHSPFWNGYTMWRRGGRKLKRGIACKYTKPKCGQYWKDDRGIGHFLRDPDLDHLGYECVAKPTADKGGE